MAFAETLGAKSVAARITNDLVKKLDADRFHLVVVGEFNHGKTTFVNALLGASILPVGVTPTTAVIHHLEYAAELYGLGRNAIGPIKAAADRFGILHALDQQVGGYSTGMKTRLALARSVLHDPELLLFDEPTSGLDPVTSATIGDLIQSARERHGVTSVVVTHDLALARLVGDRVAYLDRGRFRFVGTWEEADRAEDPQFRAFLAGKSEDADAA